MVTKTMTDSAYSYSSSSTSSSASTAPTSWSKMYGSQRKQTYKPTYGRFNSYDSASSSLEQSSSRDAGGYEGRSSSYSSSRLESNRPPRHRSSASVDRDLAHSISLAQSYEAESRVSRSAYKTGPEYAAAGHKRHSVSTDRNIGRATERGRTLHSDRGRTLFSDRGRNLSSDRIRNLSSDRSRQLSTEREFMRTSSYVSPSSRESSLDRTASGHILGYAVAHTHADTTPRVRASSVSRFERSVSYTPSTSATTRCRRAASINRIFRDEDDSVGFTRSREIATPRRAASISRYTDYEQEVDLPKTRSYRLQKEGYEQLENTNVHCEVGRARGDISGYVIRPGQRFEPNDISVCVLPSGKKAVTYTQSSQTGSGDQRAANEELEKVIQKTKFLQESMYTLEAFVKRNRSFFPKETMIYQSINFFQLNEAQLREIGESPDAIVFGVKVKERLVVPKGSDVSHILKRYYGKQTSEYEVEYEDRDKIQSDAQRQQENGSDSLNISDIRKQVELEWENRHKAKKQRDEAFEVREAHKNVDSRDRYTHMHPHMTPDYIRSYYVDAGLDYDSIYSQRSSRGSEASGDHESGRTQPSMSSAKKKKVPTATLR